MLRMHGECQFPGLGPCLAVPMLRNDGQLKQALRCMNRSRASPRTQSGRSDSTSPRRCTQVDDLTCYRQRFQSSVGGVLITPVVGSSDGIHSTCFVPRGLENQPIGQAETRLYLSRQICLARRRSPVRTQHALRRFSTLRVAHTIPSPFPPPLSVSSPTCCVGSCRQRINARSDWKLRWIPRWQPRLRIWNSKP